MMRHLNMHNSSSMNGFFHNWTLKFLASEIDIGFALTFNRQLTNKNRPPESSTVPQLYTFNNCVKAEWIKICDIWGSNSKWWIFKSYKRKTKNENQKIKKITLFIVCCWLRSSWFSSSPDSPSQTIITHALKLYRFLWFFSILFFKF